MRNNAIHELQNIAKNDSRVLLMTGDLGYGVLDDFQKEFPDRFINAGIAEQNMASVAAGLALEGNIVYLYSIGNFPVMRCLEQIRNDICYHNLNVKILAIGSGFAYGQLGMSHHATEDIGITNVLPNMTVFSPATLIEARYSVCAANKTDGACYIRLAKGGEKEFHADESKLDIFKIKEFRKGSNVAVISTGTVLEEVLEAADVLSCVHSIEIGVYNVVTLKPFDVDGLRDIVSHYNNIITVEEHNIIGGLGSIVSDIIAINSVQARITKLGLFDMYASVVGSQKYLRKIYGISAIDIIETTLKFTPPSVYCCKSIYYNTLHNYNSADTLRICSGFCKEAA